MTTEQTMPNDAKVSWNKPVRLEIRYTGNIQGNLDKLPYLGTQVKRERAAHPEMLLLDTGNFSGQKNAGQFGGMPQVEVMNYLGVDASVPGEAETKSSVALKKMGRAAKFPLLASNWKGLGEGDYFSRRLELQRSGLNLVILGLAWPQAPEDVSVVSPEQAIKEVLSDTDVDNSVIVILSQLEYGQILPIATQANPTKLIFEGIPYPGFDKVTQLSGGLLVPCVPNADNIGALGVDLSGSLQVNSSAKKE